MNAANAAEPYSRHTAAIDIGIVVAASAIAFATELAAASRLPWGEEARGVVSVIAGAAVALWLTRRRHRPLSDLGFRRPARWRTVPLWVLGIIVVYLVVQNLVPALLQNFFELSAPDMSRYESLRGNLVAAIALALILPLTASIPEEIIYRGFLIERLACLAGDGRKSWIVAVLVQALLFGLVHFQWGPGGILMTLIMGLVWGFAYLLCGRNLWVVIIAHSSLHLAFVAQLYAA